MHVYIHTHIIYVYVYICIFAYIIFWSDIYVILEADPLSSFPDRFLERTYILIHLIIKNHILLLDDEKIFQLQKEPNYKSSSCKQTC